MVKAENKAAKTHFNGMMACHKENKRLCKERDECWKSWEEFGEGLEGLAAISRESEGFGEIE